MKNYLWVLVLLSSLVYCFGLNNVQGIKEEYDEYEYDKYLGNPDDYAKIERPCQIYDIHCIRKFFAKHGKCKIASGPVPDPLIRSQSTVYFSRVNLTATLNDMQISGLNTTRIEEFYINRATNKLVIAINIQNLQHITRNIYFRFYRRAREPIVTLAPAGVVYLLTFRRSCMRHDHRMTEIIRLSQPVIMAHATAPKYQELKNMDDRASTTFTSIIPNIDDLQLDKAEITVYSDDGFPPFYIGPEVANSTDPVVAQSYAEFLADVPTDVQELMLTEGLFYPPLYIQYNICDFGLKVL